MMGKTKRFNVFPFLAGPVLLAGVAYVVGIIGALEDVEVVHRVGRRDVSAGWLPTVPVQLT